MFLRGTEEDQWHEMGKLNFALLFSFRINEIEEEYVLQFFH